MRKLNPRECKQVPLSDIVLGARKIKYSAELSGAKSSVLKATQVIIIIIHSFENIFRVPILCQALSVYGRRQTC